MLSPQRKLPKLTCQTCEHSFSSQGNVSRHYTIYPDHRPESEPNSKDAVAIFLNSGLSSYHRKARIRELFNQLTDEEIVEIALPRVARKASTSRFVYEKCKNKSGEISEKAVKEELKKLCVNLHWTFPSIPPNLVSENSLASDSPKQATPRHDMCAPDRKLLRFLDDRNVKKSLLEHLITTNENLACETMLDCCDGSIVKNTFMPLFVKKHHGEFLEFGLGLVSSFGISQNQLNTVLRGHWGKKLEEKTGLNPILPRYDK